MRNAQTVDLIRCDDSRPEADFRGVIRRKALSGSLYESLTIHREQRLTYGTECFSDVISSGGRIGIAYLPVFVIRVPAFASAPAIASRRAASRIQSPIAPPEERY